MLLHDLRLWDLDRLFPLRRPVSLHNRNIDHLVQVLNAWRPDLLQNSLDWDLPLRQNQDFNNRTCGICSLLHNRDPPLCR